MYQVSPQAMTALRSRQPKLETIIEWQLGGSEDVSSRLVEGGVSPITWALGPWMTGYVSSPVSIVLENSDKFFSPLATDSRLFNPPDSKTFHSTITVKERVHYTGGYEDVPVFKGLVRYIRLYEGVCEVRADDYMTALMRSEMPETLTIKHTRTTGTYDHRPAFLIRTLLDDYSSIDGTNDVELGSWSSTDTKISAMDWPITGRINEGTTVGDAVNGLARSALFTVFPGRDGKLRFKHEYPHVGSAGNRQPFSEIPGVIDSTNSWGHEYERGLLSGASEVIVAYQGVSATYRGPDISTIGRNLVRVELPHVSTYAQARWCARFLYEINGGYGAPVSFTQGAEAITYDLFDHVNLKDSENGVTGKYRVIGLTWDNGYMGVSAALMPSIASMMDGVTFSQWGVENWSSVDKVA